MVLPYQTVDTLPVTSKKQSKIIYRWVINT
jgi:hypothetical protein